MSVVLLGGVGGAVEERLLIAGLDVMVWKPDETAPAALPIVVSSSLTVFMAAPPSRPSS
jgi:hypothetical protein